MDFFSVFTWAIVSLIIYQSHRQRKKIVWFHEKADLTGKTAVITGGSSGIGKYAALHLAKRNCKVIITSTLQSKGEKAVEWLKLNSSSTSVSFVVLNFNDLKNVRTAVNEIKMECEGIDILIHSAGTCFLPVEDTVDRIEQTYQINHFGPQLLTEMLVPLLAKNSGRIVFTGSKYANKFGRIELNSFKAADLTGPFVSSGFTSYMNSKLMNAILVITLDDQFKKKNIPITVNMAFPGLSQTSLLRHSSLLSQFIWTVLGFIFSKYPEEGAQSVIYCAASAEMASASGIFVSECREKDFLTPKLAWDSSFLDAFKKQSNTLLKI